MTYLTKAPNLILIALVLLITGLCSHSQAGESKNELVFLTWPDYIDPDVVSEFEKSRNIKIRFVYFQSDDARDRLMLDTNGRGFDVILMSGMPINSYVKRDWFQPITSKQVPNLTHIDLQWRNAFTGSADYAVPYFWGTIGIAYRSDLIKENINSWKQLFSPTASTGKNIIMIDSNREVIGIALKALGYSVNSTDLAEIRQAESLLHQQKSFVQSYSYINITEASALVTGKATMALAFNGDAMVIKEHDSNIKFVVPEEGSIIWVDYLTVMSSSSKKELAFDFINFLNEPSIAVRLALYSNYATPNREAEKKLPEDVLSNTDIYPSKSSLENFEFEKSLTPQAAKEFSRIMSILVR